MKKRAAPLFALALALMLPACGLHPLYADGAHGAVGQFLGSVDVAPIDGKNGWLLHNALTDRFGESSATHSRYRLQIELDDKIIGFGLLRDTTTTRERRTLRARYKLIESATGLVVLDATAGSDESVDVVGSEYATIAAENTALENLTKTVADQIVARVALYAERAKPAQ
jgi:LPS-assembly lipoprotein